MNCLFHAKFRQQLNNDIINCYDSQWTLSGGKFSFLTKNNFPQDISTTGQITDVADNACCICSGIKKILPERYEVNEHTRSVLYVQRNKLKKNGTKTEWNSFSEIDDETAALNLKEYITNPHPYLTLNWRRDGNSYCYGLLFLIRHQIVSTTSGFLYKSLDLFAHVFQ